MDILLGKLWLLFFCALFLSPILYSIIKADKRYFSIQILSIGAILLTQLTDTLVTYLTLCQADVVNIYVIMMFWQLSMLLTVVSIFYQVLQELNDKYLRYGMNNSWFYVVPALFEAALLCFFNISSYSKTDVHLISAATSISLYFTINFYILVGAWQCYKGYLFNLDFDIKYISRMHFIYYLVLCFALFVQQVLFTNISLAVSFAVFLIFSFMTRSKTLISQDALSGVNNRVSFHKYINNAFINRDHNGAYIIFIDIDKFKQINDTYGHIEGDEAIELVGKTLKSIAGETNSFVARLGGDEFVLVVNTNDEDKVKTIIQSVSYELEERLIFKDKQYDVHLSAGYVHVEPNQKNIKELIAKADSRMYEDKRQKSGGVAANV